mmetsp:Transcript_52920/g.126326  ORF Transcript_52920/g.126326 Transcript_52920/m.126326 type:complete len:204 (-) Transcript_52920:960-1571(-)
MILREAPSYDLAIATSCEERWPPWRCLNPSQLCRLRRMRLKHDEGLAVTARPYRHRAVRVATENQTAIHGYCQRQNGSLFDWQMFGSVRPQLHHSPLKGLALIAHHSDPLSMSNQELILHRTHHRHWLGIQLNRVEESRRILRYIQDQDIASCGANESSLLNSIQIPSAWVISLCSHSLVEPPSALHLASSNIQYSHGCVEAK